MLRAISPVDGRYAAKTAALQDYFSEYALIKYRIKVEIEYFLYLAQMGIVKELNDSKVLRQVYQNFTESAAQRVKDIEKVTNHDVKAVEYYIKENLEGIIDEDQSEYIHFGLTSQDINNTALPLMIRDAMKDVILPQLSMVLHEIDTATELYKSTPILARTHGQPASPTTMGKEIRVFSERLKKQTEQLYNFTYEAKFGGATGNFNAHKISFGSVNWPVEMDAFIATLGLKRQTTTTQIEHYDSLAQLFHTISRINTILIDFCRDIWTYISMNYFKQKVIANEVGSSAMPHKVNPIDFENAEGNLSLANAMFSYLADKLPVSRLQRDLTDSTVTRNIGVPLAHSLIAFSSLLKGLGKLELNIQAIDRDLEENWAVVAEGIQTVLRREGFQKPYELLKAFSRGKGQLTKEDFEVFIAQLGVNEAIKQELKEITPYNYLGYSAD